MKSRWRYTNPWLGIAELCVAVRKPLQMNRELDVTTASDVSDFELGKIDVKSTLLNDKYLGEAYLESSSNFAPIIFPDAGIGAVVLGSRILIPMIAASRCWS